MDANTVNRTIELLDRIVAWTAAFVESARADNTKRYDLQNNIDEDLSTAAQSLAILGLEADGNAMVRHLSALHDNSTQLDIQQHFDAKELSAMKELGTIPELGTEAGDNFALLRNARMIAAAARIARAAGDARDFLRAQAPETPNDLADDGWILASEALPRLPFITGGAKGLRRYAAEHPDKLRLRPHPNHGRRCQVYAVDVVRLEIEYSQQQFKALGTPEAAKLPDISGAGLQLIAERLKKQKAEK